MARVQAPIRAVNVSTFTVPSGRFAFGRTSEQSATTLVLVEIEAAGDCGTGYTYADTATARLIREKLAPRLQEQDALAVTARWRDLQTTVRNLGSMRIGAMAASAVDAALWDLKARLLGIPLVSLLGQVRDSVPVYGSEGVNSCNDARMVQQLESWRAKGISRMKVRVGREPARDLQRVRVARKAVGNDAELFVDANGSYDRSQALEFAARFAEQGITWFEEPVPFDDLAGLKLVRDRAPSCMEISAGDYGCRVEDFRSVMEARAVDVVQVDLTRCGGITGFFQIATLCQAFHIPISSLAAPALHLHPCAAALPVRHMEWLEDHVRVESMLFEGVQEPGNGVLRPDLTRPGNGLTFRHDEARRYAME